MKSITPGQFGFNVAAQKKKQRLTLKELEDMSGVSQRQIVYIMGGRDTTLINADKIAGALGFTLVGLINWKER